MEFLVQGVAVTGTIGSKALSSFRRASSSRAVHGRSIKVIAKASIRVSEGFMWVS